ncbi:MAG: FCD domain-containing protein [Betaproteobacteria bacterium]|nr:FCD domain-containing protein [Betaproteobacteria bacterium]
MATRVRTPAATTATVTVAAPVPSPATPAPGLAQTIADQLQALIHAGEVLPGERLNEAALALRMGTSRGPIREAIRILTGIGLVTAVPNRGVFVRQISVREMLEIYELRALLFGHAAEQAAGQLEPVHRAEFEQLLAEMDAMCERGDGTRYYAVNLRFHALILELGGNRRAHQAYDDYVKELHLFRRRYFDAAGNMRRSNSEHRQIYEAIASGAGARARTLAQKHVLEGRQRLLATMDTEPAVAGLARRR